MTPCPPTPALCQVDDCTIVLHLQVAPANRRAVHAKGAPVPAGQDVGLQVFPYTIPCMACQVRSNVRIHVHIHMQITLRVAKIAVWAGVGCPCSKLLDCPRKWRACTGGPSLHRTWHNFCLQDSTAWMRHGSNMRVDMPKALIVSQLPLLHKDATAFPLPIRLGVFEASKDGEQAPNRHQLPTQPVEHCASQHSTVLSAAWTFVHELSYCSPHVLDTSA
jgi:hypothetical protein